MGVHEQGRSSLRQLFPEERRKDLVTLGSRTGRDCDEVALTEPTPDRFRPLLYALGAADEGERPYALNDVRTLGSISMTSYAFEM